jgi:hypothetical protein
VNSAPPRGAHHLTASKNTTAKAAPKPASKAAAVKPAAPAPVGRNTLGSFDAAKVDTHSARVVWSAAAGEEVPNRHRNRAPRGRVPVVQGRTHDGSEGGEGVSAMWEAGPQGTSTGPSIIVGETEVVAYWSDTDGLCLDIAGRVDDLRADDARATADALRQLTDMPTPA